MATSSAGCGSHPGEGNRAIGVNESEVTSRKGLFGPQVDRPPRRGTDLPADAFN